MFISRLISSVVLLAICVAALFTTPLFFVIFLLAVLILSLLEAKALLFSSSRFNNKQVFLLFLVAGGLVLFLFFFPFPTLLATLAVLCWLLRFFPLLFKKSLSLFPRLDFLLLSLCIFCACLIFNSFFRISPYTLLFILSITWMADSLAYVGGKLSSLFGVSHKLAPTISPGKSWEGLLVGALAAIALGFFMAAWANGYRERQNILPYFLTSGTIGIMVSVSIIVVVGVLGDLFESLLKRRAGVKDSSNLIPGHGGVLDRLDAQFPAVVFAWLLHTFFNNL